jgi:hypothetical protein
MTFELTDFGIISFRELIVIDFEFSVEVFIVLSFISMLALSVTED